MPAGKITKNEVIQEKEIIQALQKIKTAVDANVKSIKQFVGQAKEINKAISGSKTFKEFNTQAEKADKNVKDLTKSEQKLLRSTKELGFQTSELGKKQAVTAEKTRRARKANREYAQSQLAATKNTNTFGKAIGSFLFKANFLANVMSNVASKVTQFARKAIQEGIRGIVSFDAAMTDVRAVAQATDDQFNDLRESAIALGGATKFTATQVAELQKEYAKLGFTSDQIIQLQESTLQLATATGAQLAPAAKVVGGALRAFGKDASQARAVAATLAIATTKSALAFEDYETILSTVAPVANAYNFSLEDTLALQGQLKNANFDASKAATATRNILLNLADSNGALAKALGGSVRTLEDMIAGLIQLREEGVDLNTTLQLTDKRSVAAFNTFLIGAENALVLKEQITGVNDELDEMVNVQLSSLENKITLLSSAWAGLTQQVSDSVSGAESAKSAVGGLTTVLQNTTDVLKFNEEMGFLGRTLQLLSPIIFFQAQRHAVLAKSIIGTKEETEDYSKVIQEGGFSDLVVDLGLLRVAQDDVNDSVKEASPILEELNAQIKTLQELRQSATTEEQVKAYTLEIKALQDKKAELTTVVDLEKEAQEVRRKTIKSIRDAIKMRESLSQKDVSDGDFFDSMTLTDGEIDEALTDAEELADGLVTIAEDSAKRAAKINKERIKGEVESEQMLADIKKQLGNEAFNFLTAINDRSQENLAAQNNEELALLEDRFKRGLISEQRYEDSKLAIERKSQEESLKLRRRAAVIDKAQALFNIGINTAAGILKYGSNPVTAPLIPFITALGIAQAAVVAATPIPQFAKGTDSSPAGPAWVGEKGTELMIDSKGNVGLSPDKATVMNLKKGTQIIPADATDRILQGFTGGAQAGYMADLQETNRLLKSIRNKPVASSTITPAGVLTMVHKGSTAIKKLDRYFG